MCINNFVPNNSIHNERLLNNTSKNNFFQPDYKIAKANMHSRRVPNCIPPIHKSTTPRTKRFVLFAQMKSNLIALNIPRASNRYCHKSIYNLRIRNQRRIRCLYADCTIYASIHMYHVHPQHRVVRRDLSEIKLL